MDLMRISWFGGWCEGAGRARAHTLVYTRARTTGAGAHAERAEDPKAASHPW